MKKNLVMIALLTLSFILALSASSLATDDNKGDIIIENINFEINDEGIIPLRYSLINTITADLDIDNGIAECVGIVTTQKVVYMIEITMTLQKYSGGKWTEYAQWYDYDYHTNLFSLKKFIAVDSGSYRVHVVGTVTDYNGDEETQTATSGTRP